MSKRAASYATQIYRLLLRGYPQRYRARFGDEILATFAAAQDEALRTGPSVLLALWLRELRDWPACIMREHLSRLREDKEVHVVKSWARSQDPVKPDMPWSPSETWPVVLLFLAFGLAQIATNYLPPLFSGSSALRIAVSSATIAALLALPLAGLFVAVRRHFPRWGYPYLGQMLGVMLVLALLASTTHPGILAGIILLLVLALALPGVRAVLGRAWRDPTLLSLAFYAFLPVALLIAFDDTYRNNITGYMALAALVLPAGAWLYTRSTRAWEKYLVLWLAAMACLFLALLDVSHFTGGVNEAMRTVRGVAPAGHILSLMRNLTVLLLAPALLNAAHRLLRQPAAL